ncbi:hypothetical protein MFRU_010g00850 [Monilinia fructicola]|nr:hypothetical protein MFRU_010g00850 [Monilinia fructicola]
MINQLFDGNAVPCCIRTPRRVAPGRGMDPLDHLFARPVYRSDCPVLEKRTEAFALGGTAERRLLGRGETLVQLQGA